MYILNDGKESPLNLLHLHIRHHPVALVDGGKGGPGALCRLKVDGGAAANNLLMQFQADLLDVELIRPQHLETTAMGAAFLAGLAVGIWSDLDAVRSAWLEEQRFNRKMGSDEIQAKIAGWRNAVGRA